MSAHIPIDINNSVVIQETFFSPFSFAFVCFFILFLFLFLFFEEMTSRVSLSYFRLLNFKSLHSVTIKVGLILLKYYLIFSSFLRYLQD